MRMIAFMVWGAFLVGTINFLVLGKERILRDGETVFLALAPRDPRSLVQGDYMALNYTAANQARTAAGPNQPSRGLFVVKLDEKKVGEFVRFHSGEALAANERLLPCHHRHERWGGVWMQVGPESFFFQEGHARYYERARYGELKVDASGHCLLAGLRGEDLEPLGPDK